MGKGACPQSSRLYRALNNLGLGRAEDLFAASHELAVELANRAGQAEEPARTRPPQPSPFARRESGDLVLRENRSLLEQLHDHHQLAHADQALAVLAISSRRDAEGETLFQDVSERLREMGLTMMGGTYALGLVDLYRRAGRPSLASALLRHAMSLINQPFSRLNTPVLNNKWQPLLKLERKQHDRSSKLAQRTVTFRCSALVCFSWRRR